jgi:hypothetical protein
LWAWLPGQSAQLGLSCCDELHGGAGELIGFELLVREEFVLRIERRAAHGDWRCHVFVSRGEQASHAERDVLVVAWRIHEKIVL